MKKFRLGLILWLMLAFLFVPCVGAEGENLLQNGDFSEVSGDMPTGWVTSAWVVDELYSRFSLQHDENVGNVIVIESDVENDARFEQVVSVEPDTVYEISGKIRADGVEGSIGANLSVADTFVYSDMLEDTGGEWFDVVMYVRTGENQKEMTLYARLGGYGGTATGRAEFAGLSVKKADPDAGVWVQELEEAQSSSGETGEAAGEISLSKALPILMMVLVLCAALWLLTRKYWKLTPFEEKETPWMPAVAVIFAAALAVRIVMAVSVYGYPNDIACWKGWSQLVYEEGFAGFYTAGEFADYPPVYIIVLYFIGILRNLFVLEYDSPLFLLLVKLPSIAADLLAGWLIFRAAAKRFTWQSALGFAALFLLNPAILLNASAWGQVDSILALFMAACLWMIWKNKWVEAAITFTVGLLFKPQMLFIAPLFLPGIVFYIRENTARRSLITAGKCLGAVAATALLIVLPFTGERPLTWIIDLYTSTTAGYPYASVNAANLASLFGGLWVEDSARVLGLSWKLWGIAGIVLAVIFTLLCVFKDKKRENLFFYGALLLAGIFTMAHGMHERYMFPALVLLAVSYALTGKKLHLAGFLAFSVTQFINMAVVLVNAHLPMNSMLVTLLSLMQSLIFFALAAAAACEAWGMDVEGKLSSLKLQEAQSVAVIGENTIPDGWLGSPAADKQAKSWDRWAIWVLTAVYAVVSLVYLGDVKVPETMATIMGGESFVVDLGENAPDVTGFWQYRTLSASGASIVIEESEDKNDWSQVKEIVLDSTAANDVFKWFTEPVTATCRYIRFSFPESFVRELEFALMDGEGKPIAIAGIEEINCRDENTPALLFDEQDRIPEAPSHLNSTYFDEIYHARTAWEHKEGLYPYEITHPPLGKIIIMAGISIFGMTPFGWRVAGAVFGVFMVPLIYALAKMLLKNGKLAFAAAFMLCWDFMHFAQTRIATIDVFAVFFILCMYLCMAKYLSLSHPEADRKRRALWLGGCGLAFGLGAATKWTCIYAGAGLAVLFFIDVGIGLARYIREKRKINPAPWTKTYIRQLVERLAFCVVFFIVIPLMIYAASYAPYMLGEGFDLSVVLDNQKYMLSYHTDLKDDHFFASPWYEWPTIVKPIWFYMNEYLPEGQMGSIASFGNPAVWWVGLIGILALIVKVVRQRARCWQDWFILVGFAAEFLPWVLVPRSTFIYHYFASVPFIILAAAAVFGSLARRWPKLNRVLPVYLVLVAVLFIVFYPVLSGLPISSEYGAWLKWMPTWYFTY